MIPSPQASRTCPAVNCIRPKPSCPCSISSGVVSATIWRIRRVATWPRHPDGDLLNLLGRFVADPPADQHMPHCRLFLAPAEDDSLTTGFPNLPRGELHQTEAFMPLQHFLWGRLRDNLEDQAGCDLATSPRRRPFESSWPLCCRSSRRSAHAPLPALSRTGRG